MKLTAQLIVIASIHQPSSSTFQLFDTLLLLSEGKACYFGPVAQIEPYFAKIGHALDVYTNPAEFLLDLVSSDFAGPNSDQNRVAKIQNAWTQAAESAALKELSSSVKESTERVTDSHSRPGVGWVTLSLLHRAFIKSYRDVVAYGIRIVMYLGMCYLAFNLDKPNKQQVWQL